MDLVQAQLRIAGGESLAEVGLGQADVPAPVGYAIQSRVNMERMEPDGSVQPSGGLLTSFVPPSGPGGAGGYVWLRGVPHQPAFRFVAGQGDRAFAAGGVRRGGASVVAGAGRVRDHGAWRRTWASCATCWATPTSRRGRSPRAGWTTTSRSWRGWRRRGGNGTDGAGGAGAKLDPRDPLASLEFFRKGEGTRQGGMAERPAIIGPPGTEPVGAPLQGTVIEIAVAEGEEIREGQLLAVMSALKMEHLVNATFGGVLRRVTVEPGDTVYEDHPLFFVERVAVGDAIREQRLETDLDYIRPELQELLERREYLLDANRPEAVERRHSRGRRTVRENIEMLFDAGTFIEYGGLATAKQRRRRSMEELRRKTPADGLVAGIGTVNGDLFDEYRSRTMFISYDDTVLAGTQGGRGHEKTDRMVDLANELSLPLIFHCEGAGGRSGDTDSFEGRGFGSTVRKGTRCAG